MTKDEEGWEADTRIIEKRKMIGLPYEPTPEEEKQGVTRWTKLKRAIKHKL